MSDTYKETMKDILLDLHFQGNTSDKVDVKADAAAMIDAVGTGVKMTVETSTASRGAPMRQLIVTFLSFTPMEKGLVRV